MPDSSVIRQKYSLLDVAVSTQSENKTPQSSQCFETTITSTLHIIISQLEPFSHVLETAPYIFSTDGNGSQKLFEFQTIDGNDRSQTSKEFMLLSDEEDKIDSKIIESSVKYASRIARARTRKFKLKHMICCS